MSGAGFFDNRSRSDIGSVGCLPEVEMQVRPGAAQPPKVGGPPLGRDLYARGGSLQAITELRGKQKMCGRGRAFERRSARDLFAEKIVIVVQEPGQIDINVSPQQTAVTELVAI